MKLSRMKVKSSQMVFLAPFLDVLTVLLIFLIVTYNPDEASIELNSKMQLPQSVHHLKGIPHIKVEVTPEFVKINGEMVSGVKPEGADLGTWKVFKKILTEKKKQEEHAALLMADRSTNYRIIELAAAHLAAAGFSDIYFLTEIQHGEGELK